MRQILVTAAALTVLAAYTPATHAATLRSVRVGSVPGGPIAFGTDGAIWYANGAEVGRMPLTGAGAGRARKVASLPGGGRVLDIAAVAPRSVIVASRNAAGSVLLSVSATGGAKEIAGSRTPRSIGRLSPGPSAGTVVFASGAAVRLASVRATRTVGTTTNFLTGATFAGDGAIWYVGVQRFGRMRPDGTALGEHPHPASFLEVAASGSTVRAADDEGGLWRLAASGTPLGTPVPLSVPSRLTGDGTGNVWAITNEGETLARVSPGGTVTTFNAAGGGLFADITRRGSRLFFAERTGPSSGLAVYEEGRTLPKPVAGKRVTVAPVSGVVLVRNRKTGKFRRLRRGESVPVGTTLDTTRGRVRLTAARDLKGATQTSDFFGGRFLIAQRRVKRPVTELRLNEPLACARSASAARKRRRRRHVWGSGKGRFRTRGRYGSAAVRGTKWLTTDTCTSTRVDVRQGVVAVRDFVRRRTVRVRAGRSYTARKR